MIKSCIWFLCLGLIGCGGGTQGTGGVTIEGKILELAGQPVSGMTVTAVGSGESAVSDASGQFVLATAAEPSIGLLFEQAELQATATLANVPAATKVISARFTVDRSARSVTPRDITFREGNSSDDSGGGSSSSSSGGNSSSGGSSSSDDSGSGESDSEDDDSEGSSSSSDDEGSSSSSSSSDDEEEEEGEGSGSSSSSSREHEEEEGQEREVRGRIAGISPNVVMVDAVSFIPTNTTEYRNRSGERGVLQDFSVGDRVRARGRQQGEQLLLERLEYEEEE